MLHPRRGASPAEQRRPEPRNAPVLIVGAGPVGMVLALDLARWGVPSLLVDAEFTTRRYPKGNTHNARTMEHYRRLGLSEQVRAAGLPPDHPTDVAYFTRITRHELARLPMPSAAAKVAAAREAGVFAQVVEPIHRANQMYVEEILAAACDCSPLVNLCRGWQASGVSQRAEAVHVTLRGVDDGRNVAVRGAFLVGCDGGRSQVRQELDFRYAGEDSLGGSLFGGPMVSAHLRIPHLRDWLTGREFWQGWTVNSEVRTDLISLDGHDEYMTHAALDTPIGAREMKVIVGRALGRDAEVDVLSMASWTAGRALVADRFGSGRVFLCGDAIHIFTPTGGFGMNTGVDDAANLAWKLAATLQGWGGSALLASYETERRPVALRNTAAARQLALNVHSVEVSAAIEAPGPDGDAERRRIGATLSHFGEEFASIGVQLGARYDGSPVVVADGTAPPPDRSDIYVPTACPGGRVPHAWLRDGSSLFDRLSPGFTVLRTGPAADLVPLQEIAAARRVPLGVVDIDQAGASDFYGAPLVLVRPDQHVAWRGSQIPDPLHLLDVVTGNGPAKDGSPEDRTPFDATRCA